MIFAIIQGLWLGLWLSVSVGPVGFTILKLSMKSGHKAGYAFITGVSASDMLLVILGNAAAQLVGYALEYKLYIAAIGAGLLIIMGVYSLLFRKDALMDNAELPPVHSNAAMAKFTMQGFFINILNPAPYIFWLTTCTAFAYLPFDERVLLFATSLAVVFGTDVLKVRLAGKIRQWLTPATLHKINVISALILMGFGVVIGIGLLYKNFH